MKFGDDCSVDCEEVFAVGALTGFGTALRVACRRAYFGANGWIGRRVVVAGGGSRDPWATFAAGDLVFIGDEAFVNPCRPVLIGREVFLTMRSVLVTHNVGHSVLEGFENRFAPVVLEDRAQIGIGTVVYAGCRVGREAIVASNSYVISDIPPGKLAVGVPARVAGSASHPPHPSAGRGCCTRCSTSSASSSRSAASRSRRPTTLAGSTCTTTGKRRSSSPWRGSRRTSGLREASGETVVLTLELSGEPPAGCAVLDLLGRRVHGEGGVVLDSVREFGRKRGIRFEPGPWRYRGGLL